MSRKRDKENILPVIATRAEMDFQIIKGMSKEDYDNVFKKVVNVCMRVAADYVEGLK